MADFTIGEVRLLPLGGASKEVPDHTAARSRGPRETAPYNRPFNHIQRCSSSAAHPLLGEQIPERQWPGPLRGAPSSRSTFPRGHQAGRAAVHGNVLPELGQGIHPETSVVTVRTTLGGDLRAIRRKEAVSRRQQHRPRNCVTRSRSPGGKRAPGRWLKSKAKPMTSSCRRRTARRART